MSERSAGGRDMPLRIGFDLDGTLADFASAFRDIELSLFGTLCQGTPEQPEANEARLATAPHSHPVDTRSAAADAEAVSGYARRYEAVWKVIQDTPDFWCRLAPVEEGIVKRLFDLTLRHRWEVCFITQRPPTAGDTVQRQTQKWLARHGFDMPSVLPIRGSRGAAVGSMGLHYHVDDSRQNCLDVLADSTARPLLILPSGCEAGVAARAESVGIATAATISDGLTMLDNLASGRSLLVPREPRPPLRLT